MTLTNRDSFAAAQAAHRALRDEGTAPSGAVDSRVATSWERCRSFGLGEDARPHYDPLPHDILDTEREANRRLIQHARPVMEALREKIVNTESMVILTDAQGLILHSLGDDDFLARAEKVALRPGVVWSEASKGTNAVGTALTEEAPVIIHGPEHFLTANHILTCSAVPIADHLGKTVGCLDVSGDWRSYQRHTMALVHMSGQLIDNHLFETGFPDAIVLRLHGSPEAVGTLCQGMVAVASEGGMLSANRSALYMLGMGMPGLRCHTFLSLFGQPVSTLFEQARREPDGLLPLVTFNGTHVFAQVSLGNRLRKACQPLLHMTIEEGPSATGIRGGAIDTGASAGKIRALTAGAEVRRSAGASQEMRGALESLKTGDAQVAAAITKLQRVVGRDIAILIQGATGTGKELVARAIHVDSPRRSGPFVAVNCASIPDGLIESELFGYEDGAFTGARKKGAIGKIMLANGGTLFLDEIGDMPLNLQARLLRVLQERVVVPLGSTKAYPLDASIICATNRRLKDRIAEGQFREDLYYRLNGLLVKLPSLRERSDLPAVVASIIREELRLPQLRVSDEVLALFRCHPWPGNLRQLSNLLRTASVMTGADQVVRPEHLPDDFLDDVDTEAPPATAASPMPAFQAPGGLAARRLEELELTAIQQALAETGGNVSEASRRLGISRNTIYRKLRCN